MRRGAAPVKSRRADENVTRLRPPHGESAERTPMGRSDDGDLGDEPAVTAAVENIAAAEHAKVAA